MKKRAKKYGNTIVFQFSKDEQEAYNIEEGKFFDIKIEEVKG